MNAEPIVEVSEATTDENSNVLPTMTLVLIRCRFRGMTLLSAMLLITISLRANPAQLFSVVSWTVLLVVIIPEVLTAAFVAYFLSPFLRHTLAGRVVRVQDGTLIVSKNGIDRRPYPIEQCNWVEVRDLRNMLRNPAFPSQSFILIAPPSRLSDIFRGPPHLLCGLTEELRMAWRVCLTQAGAREWHSNC